MGSVKRKIFSGRLGRSAIWWLRRDLRLNDQIALAAALQAAEKVIPVFILDPTILDSQNVGEKRLNFLWGCLHALDQSLRQKGNTLIVRSGNPQEVLSALLAETDAGAIYAENDISPYAIQRDRQVAEALPLELVGSPVIHPPELIMKRDGSPYTIFTPFSRTWKALAKPHWSNLLPVPDRIPGLMDVKSESFPESPAMATQDLFPPGEAEAGRRLSQFLEMDRSTGVYSYATQRDRMDVTGTSQLSPYIRFGVISARQVVIAALEAIRDAPGETARSSAEMWLNELIWREFYLNIQYHFPFTRQHAFRARFRNLGWQNDPQDFDAWRQGITGYPIEDASMRQLAAAGWMHNRARMIVASFLTKDLLIDWRWGERWFMQNLVDGDPAANNGGWQWCASTGTDAAPYFRIFNPVTQSMKFDLSGDFIRSWVPELAHVPKDYIHDPWRMPLDMQIKTGCRIGKDYPLPIVDHAFARQRAMTLYKAAKA